MARVWRIVKKKYVDSAFSGKGARQAGGRFNSPGHSVVYTSGSLALAQLEILVILPTERLLAGYVAFRAEIPNGDLKVLNREELPENWRQSPAPDSVKKLGDRWIQSETSLALRVPSAVVPAEGNILINPNHFAFEKMEIEGPFDPEIDNRLQ